MKSGFDRYRVGLILWICATLIACGGGEKNKSQLGLVSPTFAPDKQALLKQRRGEVGIRFVLLEAGIDCTLGLAPDLTFQNVSCPASLPQGSYTYRLEYYIKASNTLIAWVEDRFTLSASDIDVVPELTFDINDDADKYTNFEEFLAGTNPRDASDYPPPLPDFTAPRDKTKEASAEKTPVGLGEPTIVGFDEANVSITNDALAEGFGLGETLVSWTATDGNVTKTATQRITIEDTTAPVFINDLPEIIVATTEDNLTLDGLAVPEVTDIFAVEMSSNAPASLTYAAGRHEIVWTAEDANGNKSTKTQTLIVNQAPPSDESICQAPADVNIEARDKLTVPTATELGQASGLNFTGEVTVTHDRPVTGFGVGDFTVTWTCADDAAKKTATQQVSIKNAKPVANAGIDQSVQVGDVVTLDASASSDPNKDDLSYEWTVPAGISLSSTTAEKPSFTVATGTKAGILSFDVVVNDGQGGSASDSVEITVSESPLSNQVPTADAGLDQQVEVDTLVTLDGSASRDPDASDSDASDRLNYLWIVPTGVSLSDTKVAKPTFTLATGQAAGTTLTFSLVVDDAKGGVSDPDTVDIVVMNTKPVAHAGLDQNASVSDVVTLDASASSDLNKDTLSYEWTAPAGMSLSSTTAEKPSFTVATGTKAGILTFDVVVSDGQGDTALDSVEVTILNTAPSVIAGSDRTAVIDTKVNLDGSGSSDPNEDVLTYRWSVLTVPPGSTATVVDSTLAKASFTSDLEGDYTLQLEVNDTVLSATDSLVLTAIKGGEATLGMVIIPGGSFQMGDESSPNGVTRGSGNNDEVPVHTVTVATFEMGKYEVTFDEYDSYLISKGVDTSNITGTLDEGYDNGWGRGNRPVINVSWDHIQVYLEWLNTQQGIALDDVKRYRLLTEAEWEYAARGGTTTAYSWGDTIDHDKANYGKDSCCGGLAVAGTRDTYLNTAPVGQFQANPFGLYDMHGNVWEWVEDCGHDSYTGAPSDGSAWVRNCIVVRSFFVGRVLRGGSWDNVRGRLRSATRGASSASHDSWNGSGFRLARTL